MSDLPKAYEAKTIDTKWYQFWEGHQFFKADPFSSKPAYCIVMPPPNVTGVLHMGHALVSTLQDILIRWKRMLGFEVLWVPGTDHAGISTQTVVERHLIRTYGKKRKDYSREDFLSHVWSWKVTSETRIIEQLKRLGSSCDWSRLRFTMDEGNNRAVRTIFKKLFDAGLIYRGDYLVNWDPVTQTALADDEVEHEERQSFLWHIKYPLADGSGFIHIATTRPETMLGDTAVAVSPSDPRYTHLIGKEIKLPLTNRLIPIIADHHVDPAFGTGVVKVTPAHDPNDYQMGRTHNLPFINIMTPDGCINANGGEFEGLSMADARGAVVESLRRQGFLGKIEPHVHRVGVSYRSKATIEPYLSKQWFVRMEDFAKHLRDIVVQGKTRLIPLHWESTYFHWIDNLRDWCISRQLWWGHRIPIWYHRDDPERMICHDGTDLPDEVKQNPNEWIQDSDVLDTWFSSALWPFSTLGWPDQTPELEKFYPNSTLVTGHDILFFWVARMLAMGEYAMGHVPFPETFLHGLIYGKSYWRERTEGGILYVTEQERLDYDLGKPIPKDVFSKWEKMSKSKGNIIDPLEMIDQYGTDAVRMALCASATQARQIDLDRRRFEEFKNFANKIWNGARFVLMNLEENEAQGTTALGAREFSQGINEELLALEDRWILSTLNRTVQSVNRHLERYEFDQAALEAYDFFWKEFCAYYVEISKPVLFGKLGTPLERANKQKMLVIVLCQAIRLMHPMAPFITEELFHILKEQLEGVTIQPHSDPYTQECIRALKSAACLIAPFPQVIRESDLNPEIDQTFALMEQVIYTIRNIRGEMKLSPGTATDVYFIGKADDPDWQTVQSNIHMIAALVRTQKIEVLTAEPKLGFTCTGVYHALKIILPLPEELLKQELQRLTKEQDKLNASLEKLRTQLANPDFVSRAPAQLIEKQQQQLAQGEKELEEISRKLQSFQ
jgi:valyl-tRNA synthetase